MSMAKVEAGLGELKFSEHESSASPFSYFGRNIEADNIIVSGSEHFYNTLQPLEGNDTYNFHVSGFHDSYIDIQQTRLIGSFKVEHKTENGWGPAPSTLDHSIINLAPMCFYSKLNLELNGTQISNQV